MQFGIFEFTLGKRPHENFAFEKRNWHSPQKQELGRSFFIRYCIGWSYICESLRNRIRVDVMARARGELLLSKGANFNTANSV